jgi:hypothetical protein
MIQDDQAANHVCRVLGDCACLLQGEMREVHVGGEVVLPQRRGASDPLPSLQQFEPVLTC